MNRKHSITIAAVATLLLAAGVPATVAAESTLDVSVDQAGSGAATVTVTDNGTVVENASVEVSAVGNDSYAGEGDYETDENGTITLVAPDEDVTVTVNATDGDRNGSTTTVLAAPSLDVEVDQAPDGTAIAGVAYDITGDPAVGATVNVSTVDENETYAGADEYTTDENGTITLPAPETAVKLRLEASAGDVRGNASVILQNASDVEENYRNFGARVSAFVHSLIGSHDGGIGRIVADFVTENNPGNAPEFAGPPADGERGGPAAAQGGNSTATQGVGGGGNGPPDHAANDKHDDDHPGKAKGR